MGYTFALDGEQYQKCRYMAFQPTLSEENSFRPVTANACKTLFLSLLKINTARKNIIFSQIYGFKPKNAPKFPRFP